MTPPKSRKTVEQILEAVDTIVKVAEAMGGPPPCGHPEFYRGYASGAEAILPMLGIAPPLPKKRKR